MLKMYFLVKAIAMSFFDRLTRREKCARYRIWFFDWWGFDEMVTCLVMKLFWSEAKRVEERSGEEYLWNNLENSFFIHSRYRWGWGYCDIRFLVWFWLRAAFLWLKAWSIEMLSFCLFKTYGGNTYKDVPRDLAGDSLWVCYHNVMGFQFWRHLMKKWRSCDHVSIWLWGEHMKSDFRAEKKSSNDAIWLVRALPSRRR